jgi:hypothetical protein
MRGGGSSSASMPARIAPLRVTSAARVSAVPLTSGAQANRHATVIQISPNGRVISGNGRRVSSVDFDSENGVPGLGFDFVHLAAINGNFRNNLSNFGHGERHQHNFFTPIFFGGFPYYYGDSLDYEQVQRQPQIIVIQQPAPAVTVQQAAPVSQESTAAPVIPAVTPAPVREVGEFILVRRDGRVLFASAFSVVGAQLQYVTPEGIRRSLPLAELDAVATQDMNEARGTTVQLPN